jgi:hypothetical protein
VHTATLSLIEQLGECGFRISLGSDTVAAVSLWTGERFFVRGGDWDAIVDELDDLILGVMEV